MIPHTPQTWRANGNGVRLLARVTTKAARDGVGGVMQTPDGPALQVRVRAVPENGAANRSVETVVAQWLDLPRTRVTVAQGGKSRCKMLDIRGEPGELQHRIAARVAALR